MPKAIAATNVNSETRYFDTLLGLDKIGRSPIATHFNSLPQRRGRAGRLLASADSIVDEGTTFVCSEKRCFQAYAQWSDQGCKPRFQDDEEACGISTPTTPSVRQGRVAFDEQSAP